MILINLECLLTKDFFNASNDASQQLLEQLPNEKNFLPLSTDTAYSNNQQCEIHQEYSIQLGRQLQRKLQSTPSIQGCLVYVENTNNQHCQQCAQGYILFLRDAYNTLCALPLYSPQSGLCQLPLDQNAANNWTQPYFVNKMTSNSPGFQSFCYSDWIYFKQTLTAQATCQDFEITNLSTFYPGFIKTCSACLVQGYDSELMVEYPSLGFTLRACQQTTQCSQYQVYDTNLEKCVNCQDLFPNCATCNLAQCTSCQNGFYLNQNFQNTNTTICVVDTCQIGYCKDLTNQICRPSIINGCVMCSQPGSANVQQTCQLCANGKNYNPDTQNCDNVPQQAYPTNLTYYVIGNQSINSFNGQGPDMPFIFLQQAINQMIIDTSQSIVSYNVTIYIGNGNSNNSVFFFYCNQQYEQIYNLNAAQIFNNYCNINQNPLNYLSYQTNDNVNLTIMPLYCTLQQSLITAQTSSTFSAAFNQYCIKQIGSIDYRPLIIVNDAYTNINITGKVRLVDLRFTGINQMAVPAKKSLYFSAIPIQLCDIAQVPNGFDGNLALTALNPNFPFNYSCIDSYYSGPSNISFINSSSQCTVNQGSQFSTNIESTLNCMGRLTDPNFFLIDVSGTYYYRRRTLFNIYSFPLYQTVSNKTPELHINNCDFQYFLNNYESLIYVETDTFWKITQQQQSLTSLQQSASIYYFSAGTDRGAKINITSSTFQNSRFCKGMIAYRGSYMVPSMKILVNYTRIFVSSQIKQDAGAYIILSNSKFQNLNIFTSVSALANFQGVNPMYQVSSASDSFSLPTFIHKGIVLNMEDFGGRVEVSGSTFLKNMHFIPAIQQEFQDQQALNNQALFLDAKITLEYKMSICSTINFQDMFFFNSGFFYGDNVENFFDSFERLGVIYISRNRDAMIFRNNRFQQNIGTFGGAITINSPDWTRGQNPSIIISANWFQQNMAYFSGNAVYIRSTMKKTDTPNLICGGVKISENNFLNNIGMKIHNGGAVSALCNYIIDQNYDDYIGNSGQQKNSSKSSLVNLNMISQQTMFVVDTYQAYIALNNFQENFSGMKGTALQIIQYSNITIDNCQFQSNGPVYASLEMLYSPYSLFFAHNGAITFRDNFCSDELKFLDTCKTSDDQQIYWSRVQGALYVAFCQQDYCKSYQGNHTQTLSLTNSQFINNDVGPILDDTLYDNINDPTASQIFISGGNNTIQNCLFQGNFQPVKTYFPSFNLTTKLQRFFPDQYFNSSTSSMIVITLNPQIKQNFTIYNTTISQCSFLQNKNYQIFGFSSGIYYSGSLIRYINLQSQATKYLPLLSIQDSNFIENQFKGPGSGLISVLNALFQLKRCNFTNNGFLSSQIYIGNKTKANITATSFTLQSNPNFNLWQEQGMITLQGTTQYSNASYIHEFMNNTFSYLFSSKGAAMTLNINSQDALLQGNKYSFLFSDQGGQMINFQGTTTRSTIMMINETIKHVYSLNYAAISMFPQNPVLSLIVKNSSFYNLYGKQNLAIYASAIAKLLVDNTNFTQENFQGSKILLNRIASNFKIYQTLVLSNFIDQGYLKQFVNQESVSQSGMIYIEMTTNNQDLQFGGNVVQSLANYSYTQYSEITNCLFSNIVAYQYSAISILQSMLRVYNNQTQNTKRQSVGIFNNIVTNQGQIGISTGSTFLGVNLDIKNNSASMASGIFATSSILNLQNVRFLNNTCLGSGTLTIQAETSLLCQQCTFIGNQANDSSTIFAFSNKNSTVTVLNSAFTQNTAFTNLITMLYSVGQFTNVTFFDNLAQNVNNGLTLISSNVSLTNVTVNYTDPVYLSQSSYRVDSGFLNLNYQSYLNVSSSNFQNCRGAVSSFAYVSGASTIFINSGTIIQNGVAYSGQTIYGSMAQLIQIDRSIFLMNSLKNVYLEQTIGIITNSYFSGSQSSEIILNQASATIINNTFVNGQNFGIDGKGINCVGNNLTLINNTFRNLSAVRGGAIYLESTNIQGTSFYVYNNVFWGNKAQQGGAMYISNALLLQVLTNTFNMNQAFVINPSTTESSTLPTKGLGGAIYYACQSSNGLDTNCTVNLFQKNMFINNFAANDGGALIYVNTAYITDNTNIFNNNTAFYGNNSASYASQISMQFLNNGDYLNPYNSSASPPNSSSTSYRRLQSQSLGSMPNIVSGTPFSFNIYILDQNGAVYTTDNISKASLKPAGDSDLVIVNGDVIAQNGVFQFSNVIVTTKPGSQINVQIEISGTQTYGNPVSFLESPMQFSTTVRNCTHGESYESDGSCKVCAAGTFLYAPPETETFCQPCNQYAICYGGAIVSPIPGYWRSSNVSNNFIECLQPALCLGGNQSEPVGVCTRGNTGILCAECQYNFKRGSQYQCTECPSNKINTIQIVLIGIVAVFVVVFLVRSTLQSATKQKPVYSVYLKILTNHFQMIGAIQFIDFHWPNQIQQYQQGQSQVPQSTSNALSFDCFIMAHQDQKTQDDNLPVFYFKLIIFGVLPILLAIMDLFFWSGAYQFQVVKEKFGKKKQEQKDMQVPQTENEKVIPTTTDDGLSENDISYRSKFISTLVVLLFLVQPNIAQIMFMAFDCTQVDNEFRLKQYTKSVCYQGQHLHYILILVGPSVILWAFGIPLFSSFLLKLEYKTIQVMKEKVITEQQKKDILILKQKYGFLFAGYQPRTLYWETVIMLRKTCMIMATVFFSTFSAEIQVLTVLLIIIVSWFLQIFFEPYYTDTLNRMENYSLQVSAVTLYSGMYYVTGIHYSYMSSDFVGWLFLFIILAPNIAFFTFWGLQMRIEILKMLYAMNKPQIFKIVACMEAEVFWEKYMKQQEEDEVRDAQIVIKGEQDREKEIDKLVEKRDAIIETDAMQLEFNNVETEQNPQSKRIKRKIQRREERYRVPDDQINSLGESEYHIGTPKGRGIHYLQSDLTNFEDGPVNTNPRDLQNSSLFSKIYPETVRHRLESESRRYGSAHHQMQNYAQYFFNQRSPGGQLAKYIQSVSGDTSHRQNESGMNNSNLKRKEKRQRKRGIINTPIEEIISTDRGDQVSHAEPIVEQVDSEHSQNEDENENNYESHRPLQSEARVDTLLDQLQTNEVNHCDKTILRNSFENTISQYSYKEESKSGGSSFNIDNINPNRVGESPTRRSLEKNSPHMRYMHGKKDFKSAIKKETQNQSASFDEVD